MATRKKTEADYKVKVKQPEQTTETADDYIAREYGEAIKAGNIAHILEGILVEIVKWRMVK